MTTSTSVRLTILSLVAALTMPFAACSSGGSAGDGGGGGGGGPGGSPNSVYEPM